MDKLGFIGLGDQGAPIARRMIDGGLPVVLWARRRESLEPFADTPAELVTEIEVFAERVNYVGICVVDDNGVNEVCSRLMPRLRTGSTLVIHSTVSPQLCRTLADEATAHQLKLIDAPVSGGSPAASAGTLSVMVGGDEAVLNAVQHVFETFAKLIIHLGEVGAGQHAKLINNSLLAANMGLAFQALEAAGTLALDRQAFVELINASSGRSFGFEVCARMPNPGSFRHGASLLSKDVALLGGALGNHDSFAHIEFAARKFLDLALQSDSGSSGQ